MRGHIVWSLGRVDVQVVSIWHQTIEKVIQVPLHIRIGILIDEQRGTGVMDKDRREALFNARPAYGTLDLPGHFVGAAS